MRTLSSDITNQIQSTGNEPVKLLTVSLASSTLYYSDRAITVDSNNYLPLVLDWGNFSVDYNVSNAMQANISGTISLFKDSAIMTSLLSNYNWYNRDITISLYYPAIDESIELVKGRVNSISAEDDVNNYIAIYYTDLSLIKKNAEFTHKIDDTTFPSAFNDHIGQPLPIAFGDVKKSPCKAIDIGARTNLDGSIYDADTTIIVLDTTNYPTSGTIIIDAEEITYTGKTSTTFTGCARGTNSTLATYHRTGTEVIEKQTYYVFACNDDVSKSIDAVYIDDRKLSLSSSISQDATYDNTTGAGVGFGLLYNSSYQKVANKFTPIATGLFTKISLRLQKYGAPSGNLKIGIFTDSSGNPDTLITEYSNNVTASTAQTSADWVDFTFPNGVNLSSGVTYWIVLEGTYAQSTTDLITWTSNTAQPNYAKVYNGSTWVLQGATALYKTYYVVTSNIEAIVDNNNTDYGRALSIIKLTSPPQKKTTQTPISAKVGIDIGSFANIASTATDYNLAYDNSDNTYATLTPNQIVSIKQNSDLTGFDNKYGVIKKVWAVCKTRSQFKLSTAKMQYRVNGSNGTWTDIANITSDKYATSQVIANPTSNSTINWLGADGSMTGAGYCYTDDEHYSANRSLAYYFPFLRGANFELWVDYANMKASSPKLRVSAGGANYDMTVSATGTIAIGFVRTGYFSDANASVYQQAGSSSDYEIRIHHIYYKYYPAVENTEIITTRSDITSFINGDWSKLNQLAFEVRYNGSETSLNCCVHEMYFEVEYEPIVYETGWDNVYCDIQGCTVDSTTSGALIQSHSDAITYLLKRLGVSSGNIDSTSFDALKTARNAESYQCNGTIYDTVSDAYSFIELIAQEAKSVLYAFNGKFYLVDRDSGGSSVTTFICSQSSLSQNIERGSFHKEDLAISSIFTQTDIYYSEDYAKRAETYDKRFIMVTDTNATANTALNSLDSKMEFYARFCTSKNQADDLLTFMLADNSKLKSLVMFNDVFKSIALMPFDLIGITRDSLSFSNKTHEVMGLQYIFGHGKRNNNDNPVIDKMIITAREV